jgi:hypothetical protein
MRAFVFTDPALESEAGRFVWLDLNTERAENAAVVAALHVRALPTYYIEDPSSERILARRLGGATVAQLKSFLDTGHDTFAGRKLSPADRDVMLAESLYAAGKTEEAIEAYRVALTDGGPGWSGYPMTVEALLYALQMHGDNRAAALLARETYPRVNRTPSAANVAAVGLDSAMEMASGDTARAGLVRDLLADAAEVTSDRSIPVAADDRSSAFGSLISAQQSLGDSVAARSTIEAWAAFLEGEAARARTPEERAVFDSHRLSAYLELGEPERAIPMLQQSERDLAHDYNPPARLAVAYLRMGRLDDALSASDRALAKAYGPRKLRILWNRADILDAKRDAAGAHKTLEDALALARSMPPGQRSESMIARIEKRLAGS